jgi:hypothetical protein
VSLTGNQILTHGPLGYILDRSYSISLSMQSPMYGMEGITLSSTTKNNSLFLVVKVIAKFVRKGT